MKNSVINKIGFQASLLVSFIFIICFWALNPISNEDLLSQQKQDLKNISTVYSGILKKNIESLNQEIFYFTTLLSTTSEESLDTLDSSIRAIFELGKEGDQLFLHENEVRSAELEYWSSEDIAQEINKNFNADDNYTLNEFLSVKAPNGDNYFGYLLDIEGRLYFSLLSLHFASAWAGELNLIDTDITLVNTIGEVVYHNELQYIGSNYVHFESLASSTSEDNFKQTRQDLFYNDMVSNSPFMAVVKTATWEKPYGYSFYLKLILCLIASLLLYYIINENLKAARNQTLNFNSKSSIAITSGADSQLVQKNSELAKEIKKLEKIIARKSEYQTTDKSLYEIKSKVAHVIGQIQLMKGSMELDGHEEFASLEFKIREIYKKVYQMLDNPIDNAVDAGPSEPPALSEKNIYDSSSANKIDYEISDEIEFYDSAQRIEITEKDISGVDPNLLGELDSSLPKDKITSVESDTDSFSSTNEETESLISEAIEKNVEMQLAQQQYNKKPFSLEEDFLETQKKQILNLNKDKSFSDQIKEVDLLMSKVDEELSKNKVKDIIRKPRVNK